MYGGATAQVVRGLRNHRCLRASGFPGEQGAWMGWRGLAWRVGGTLPLLAGCALLGRERPEPPEQAAARVELEARIRVEVEARLAHEPSLAAGSLRVEVNRTDVHLHGSVAGYGAMRCALATAGLARGVTLVVDYLVILPGPGEVHCLAPRVFGAE
jgi:hypothetical protein